MRAIILHATVISAALFASGCGDDGHPDVYPVSGAVTYQGEPVAGATVKFMTDGAPRVASGVTNDKGEFKLSTYKLNDGAVPGTHRVAVLKIEKPKETGTGDDKKTADDPTAMAKMFQDMAEGNVEEDKHLLPERYSSIETTDLQEEVTAEGPNEFIFQLTD